MPIIFLNIYSCILNADWLRRNSYRGTKENRVLLVSIIPIVKTHYAKESIQNLLWTELDEFRENFTGKFFELEK